MKWLKKWFVSLTIKKLLKEADKLMDWINKYEDIVLEVMADQGIAGKVDDLTDLVGALIKKLRKL